MDLKCKHKCPWTLIPINMVFKSIQSSEFLGKLPGPLFRISLPLAENILTPLALPEAASTACAGIQKKIFWSGATLLDDINNMMKIVKPLENSDLFIDNGCYETIEN